jgi:predicted AAA+ superfamily ATPase
MIFLHLKLFAELLIPKASLFYWRTTAGKEVDFILEHGRKLLAFEVKLTPNPTLGDARNLLTFIEENPNTIRGVLIHSGKSIRWLHSKVLAVPWTWLSQ